MQSSADSDELFDKNYKIPKRKASEMDNNSTNTALPSYANQQQTPLTNSYYNYNNGNNYQYPNTTAYFGSYAQYYSAYNTAMSALQPPPPPPGESNVDPVTQGIYKALTDIKEKPKNMRANIFQHTVPDIVDETLPKDLKALFQPLFCKLCSSQLSSNLNAKMHYKSKNHEKKLRKWLIEYSERTGEPLHKRARTGTEKKSDEAEKNPTWFHCNICDLPLTGQLHAESHYMGKNHQKAMMGKKAPAGQGYYNDDGKWVRLKSAKSKAYNFENGEDNFGNAFNAERIENSAPTPKASKQSSAQQITQFHCEVCNINTTCQDQLDSHYRGSKHQKKLKQAGLTKYTEQRELIAQSASVSAPPIRFDLPPPPPPSNNTKTDINLSVYRTPSGDFYCPSCNITSNSEPQFLQHMKSKSHTKKAQKKSN